MPDPSVAILPGRDIADDLAILFGDKNARRFAGYIVIDMPRLSPPPIMAIDHTKALLDAMIDRYADEPLGRQTLQMFEVARLIRADMHVQVLVLRFYTFVLQGIPSPKV